VKIDEDVNLVTTQLVGFLTHIKKIKNSFHDGRLVTSWLMMHVAHPTWVRSSPIHSRHPSMDGIT
jgi:hypothetical protein